MVNESVQLQYVVIVDKYFMGVTCFLLFNVCAMCGSLMAAIIEVVMPAQEFFELFIENCYFYGQYSCVSENVFAKNANTLYIFCGIMGKW